MEIRFFNAQDVVAYRDLRLYALKEAPTAFASSYEQEAQLSLADFADRLRPSHDAAGGVFGAFSDRNQLIGMLGFSREHRPKRSHVGSLWSMYVLPEFRGQKVGSSLLDCAIAYARELEGLRQIVLSTTASNVAARSLYISRGFESFGVERDALCVEGNYFDEEHLVLRLTPNVETVSL
ncbi:MULTISPECIES: GNAT family N-acetyltransferase [Cyanophyceae]|uniref:GNAT family N-acetyltransferase n=1 Tax=Cyanophyceae TaxID=3028117 RepID=UPI001688D001|nr:MULTISPECIES: GNAT family N-acetyltransferase [Cyanophyceae]MBD1918472.1 GNAT family N-acetyltransferase [Phormidium sp. FACHB-77]MBD2031361.1 GNAT family N-acetyltransferase [Phormidium sp. FACHB-322]MBD2049481.1 GNAT family N-acetyltransferase [Leptolyngbya sp. FACHB-60]